MQSSDDYGVAHRYKHEDKQSTNTTPKNWPLIIGSAIVALPFVANAFGALSHRNTKDYSWEWLESLSGIQFILAILSALSALVVNTFSNIASIPLAIKKFKEICYSLLYEKISEDWRKYFKNLAIFFLAVAAGAAAVAIGWSAFLWAGPGWAAFNAVASGFIFLATRVFGLVTFVEWVDRKIKQRQYVETLTHLRKDYIQKINEKLASRFEHKQFGFSKEQDEEIITFAFTALGDLINGAPDEKWEEESTSLERIQAWTVTILEAVIVIMTLLAILPTFGQKFFDGFQLLLGWFSTIDLKTVPTYTSAVASTVLSLATPALYLRQILTLKDALTDAAANVAATLNNSKADSWEKAGKILMVPALLVINFFACLGIYNLTESTAQESNNLYKDIIPTQGSTAFTIFQLSATGGAMITNGNFTLLNTLAHPRPIKEGSGTPKFIEEANHSNSPIKVDDIARYLNKFTLTQPTLHTMSDSLTRDEYKEIILSRPRSGAISR